MFKKISFLLFILLPALFSNGQVKILRPHYNPIIPDNLADPSVVCFNGTFYLYGTTDIDHDLDKMGPPVVWKSKDFVNWHFEGLLETVIDWNKPYVFNDKDGKEKTGFFRYWAPGKVLQREGKFYLFVTIVKPDDQMGVYVMKADRPEGPFAFTNGKTLYFNEKEVKTDEAKPIIKDDIDGEPFVDDDGQAYIYWRRRKASAVSRDWLSLTGEVVNIPTRYKNYSEGPGLFKRSGIYYYFYTLSAYASYSNAYMISRKGPLGPFEEPKGKNVFIYSDTTKNIWGPGHGNVFHLPNTDEYYFVYLEYGEGSTTRQVYANRIEFNADGTIKPVAPDQEGVGALTVNPDRRVNIAPDAKVTASSYRSKKSTKGDIAADDDSKLLNAALPVKHVQRFFDYLPENAADNSNGTRWLAAAGDPSPWIMFDLGKVVPVKSCEMSFVLPEYGQSWILEKSIDGKHWETSDEQKELAIRSPQLAKAPGRARFLRLRITKGEPGLWEMKIF